MNHDNRGFTLIELMLAMAFLATLLLAIAVTVLQLGSTYNHGLTLRDMQQTSRTITSDLSYDVSNASAFSLNANGGHYITQPWGGALCLGQYSYVWNFGQAVTNYNNTHQTGAVNLLVDSSGNKSILNLVKVNDAGGSLCTSTAPKVVNNSNAVELIQGTDHSLALHEFCITTQPSASYSLTGQELYNISYAIGTNDPTALTTTASPQCAGVNTSDNLLSCLPPSALNSNFDYCADQQFSLVARAQNASN